MDKTIDFDAVVSRQSIRAHNRASLNVLKQEVREMLEIGSGYQLKPDAPCIRALIALQNFDSADHQRFLVGPAPRLADLVTADVGLVNLHRSAQLRPPWRDHCCPELVQNLKCRLVSAQSSLLLELKRRNPRLERCHQKCTQEPHCQRRMRAFHNGARNDADLAAAVGAFDGVASFQLVMLVVIAVRAREASWPADSKQLLLAIAILAEHLVEFALGLRERQINFRHCLPEELPSQGQHTTGRGVLQQPDNHQKT